jgi:uncharacterized protein
MRIVFDTNVVISGLLWSGAAQRALNLARDGIVASIVTEAMLDELREVLTYTRLTKRLQVLGKTPEEIVESYLVWAQIVEENDTVAINVVLRDEDDRIILSCAINHNANAIISGDDDLLSLQSVENIPIWTIAYFLEQMTPSKDDTEDN